MSTTEHTVTAKAISTTKAIIGESPIWSEREQVVYWIDCNAPALMRTDPATGAEQRWDMPARIGGVVLAKDGLIVVLKHGIFRFDPESGELSLIAPNPTGDEAMALHEAICDPDGRLWTGIINLGYLEHNARGGARLYRLDGDRLVECVEAAGGTVSNGLAWNGEATIMYYADSADRVIWAFDYDRRTGTASNRRVLHQLAEGDGLPDGAAVDRDGTYWFACPGKACLRGLAPDGRLVGEVPMPCGWPTKVAFGGEGNATMFVTSHSLRGTRPGHEDVEGLLFAMPAPVPGTATPLYG